jgi:peptidoglycan/LPS O-acetylase OafA/YrhL
MESRPDPAPAPPTTSACGAPLPRRLDNLTGLRAFAATWVMLNHFGDSGGGVGEFLTFPWIIMRGAFGVDVFFVLSGFVITFNYLADLKAERPLGPAYRDYLAKRIARIYPLHLLTFMAVALLLWERASVGNYPVSETVFTPFAAVLNLTLMHAWGILDRVSWHVVSWTLSAEWFAYLIVFPVCVYLLERLTFRRAALLVAATWLTFAGITLLLEHRSVATIKADGFLRILPEFAAGYLLCRIVLGTQGTLLVGKGGGLLLVAACALAFWPISYLSGAWELGLLPAILVLLLGLLRGGRVVNAVFGNRLAVFLGETSFALYMIHPFIQIVGNHVMKTHPVWRNAAHALPILLIEVAACYLAAAAVYFAIERPCRRGTLTLLRRTFLAPRALAGAVRPSG